jgi:hypothetical protein
LRIGDSHAQFRGVLNIIDPPCARPNSDARTGCLFDLAHMAETEAWVAAIGVFACFGVLIWHETAPDAWRFLTESEIKDIYEFLFTGALGALLVGEALYPRKVAARRRPADTVALILRLRQRKSGALTVAGANMSMLLGDLLLVFCFLIWLVRRDSIGRGRTSRPSKSQG